MTSSTDQLANLQEAVIDFLWDQWILLGVAGSGREGDVPFVIDPEALLLATLHFGKADARLRGEVLDWLTKNGREISLQRIKNVQRATPLGRTEELQHLAKFMEDAGCPNWKSLRQRSGRASADSQGEFIPKGFHARGMSQLPNCEDPQAFVFRMRALFGVGARPEILTWILTHRSGYPAKIARDCGWFSKSVQAILHEFELSNLLVSQADGKRRLFSLNPRNGLLLPSIAEDLAWFPQGWFYLGVVHVETILRALANRPNQSVRARAISVRERHGPLVAAFQKAGLDELYSGGMNLAGEALLHSFFEGTHSLAELISNRSFPITRHQTEERHLQRSLRA